jgi:L-threonylcarbamoyladenylate synthase
MDTAVWPVDPTHPDPEAIRRAADVLRHGGLVAFPTETVYGLGANALDAAAVGRIFTGKGRPATNPVIVHIADLADVHSLVSDWPETAARLAERFWPGPLTLVLPRSSKVPDVVTAGGPTVAVRMPAHPVARALVLAAGVPIAAPSANRSTRLSPTRAEHVLADLEGRIDAILDGGPCPGGLESTVLDLTTTPPRVLRPGLVTPMELDAVLGCVTRPTSEGEQTTEALPSPGMLARHYAPRAVLESCREAEARAREWNRAGLRVGLLTFAPLLSEPGLIVIPMPTDAVAYSARLYSALHDLDRAGVERIVVESPPETEEWLAVRDRLRRAATREAG